jgi:ABC-type uncharacterized transport system permease subunit
VIAMLKTILYLKLKSLQAQLAYPASFGMQVASIALIGFLGIPALLLLKTAFPSIGGLAFVITFVFPYAFVAYYPTLHFFQIDIEMLPGVFAYLTPVVAVASTTVAVAFWSFGLRHYQSTGT